MDQTAVLLRYRNSFDEKHRKLLGYLRDGVVTNDEPFVIAINGGLLRFPESDAHMPNIVRAFLPIGQREYQAPFSAEGVSDEFRVHYPYQPLLEKKNKGTVPTTVFTDPENAGVSGVLFSPSAIWNAPAVAGSETVFLHNPHARNPLPRGTLKFGREYWIDLVASEVQWEVWKDGKPTSGRT